MRFELRTNAFTIDVSQARVVAVEANLAFDQRLLTTLRFAGGTRDDRVKTRVQFGAIKSTRLHHGCFDGLELCVELFLPHQDGRGALGGRHLEPRGAAHFAHEIASRHVGGPTTGDGVVLQRHFPAGTITREHFATAIKNAPA